MPDINVRVREQSGKHLRGASFFAF